VAEFTRTLEEPSVGKEERDASDGGA